MDGHRRLQRPLPATRCLEDVAQMEIIEVFLRRPWAGERRLTNNYTSSRSSNILYTCENECVAGRGCQHFRHHLISGMGERGVGVIGPALHALLKNDDGGSAHQHCPRICSCIVKAMRSILLDPESASGSSAHLLRQDARGGGKCLHLCMTRKQVTLAGEDCEIIIRQDLLCARSTQLQVKCAPAACSGFESRY